MTIFIREVVQLLRISLSEVAVNKTLGIFFY